MDSRKQDRSSAGKNIPDINLEVSDNFYIKKLDMHDDKEAAIAEKLAIDYNRKQLDVKIEHVLTSENHAFYVLCERKNQKSNINKDKIYAYAWANKASRDILVFDYVEPYKATKKQLIKYAKTQKEFKLPASSVDIDFNLLVTEVTGSGGNAAAATILAAHFGHDEFLAELLARHNNVNIENEHNRDALFYAIVELLSPSNKRRHTNTDSYKACIKILLDAKADLNKQNQNGNTALILAVKNHRERYLEAMKILITAKADFTIKNNKNETALSMAKERNYKDIVKLLESAAKNQRLLTEKHSHTFFRQTRSSLVAAPEADEPRASPKL